MCVLAPLPYQVTRTEISVNLSQLFCIVLKQTLTLLPRLVCSLPASASGVLPLQTWLELVLSLFMVLPGVLEPPSISQKLLRS